MLWVRHERPMQLQCGRWASSCSSYVTLRPLCTAVPTCCTHLLYLRPTRYQDHHNVRITDAALAAAASLSDAYLPDKQLPDKAIDLIDEAAAKVRVIRGRPEGWRGNMLLGVAAEEGCP